MSEALKTARRVCVCSSLLAGQILERIATEFNQLQFHAVQSKGMPLLDKVRPVSARGSAARSFASRHPLEPDLCREAFRSLCVCLPAYCRDHRHAAAVFGGPADRGLADV